MLALPAVGASVPENVPNLVPPRALLTMVAPSAELIPPNCVTPLKTEPLLVMSAVPALAAPVNDIRAPKLSIVEPPAVLKSPKVTDPLLVLLMLALPAVLVSRNCRIRLLVMPALPALVLSAKIMEPLLVKLAPPAVLLLLN
jgi:hypothetical protein